MEAFGLLEVGRDLVGDKAAETVKGISLKDFYAPRGGLLLSSIGRKLLKSLKGHLWFCVLEGLEQARLNIKRPVWKLLIASK